MKKDLFNLQLENHFLKDRLANTTDEHFRAMHNENVKLKLEVVNYAKEMKRLKKIIMQQDKGMKELQRQLDELSLQGRGDDGTARQLEGLWKEEKERRKKLEETVKVYEEGNADASTLRHQLDEVEESERGWRQRCEELEEEMKATAEDQAEEMERLRDQADRAQEELEKAQAEGGNSSGLDKEAEEGLRAQIAELEDVSWVPLQAASIELTLQELERLRLQGAGNEELEDVS
jgi:chromosome segregation ATPase